MLAVILLSGGWLFFGLGSTIVGFLWFGEFIFWPGETLTQDHIWFFSVFYGTPIIVSCLILWLRQDLRTEE